MNSHINAALGGAATVLLLLTAGCQSSGSTGDGGAPPAGQRLTIAEIGALLVGNTVNATTADGRSDNCAFHSTETHTSASMIVDGVERNGANAGPIRGFYRIEAPSGAADPQSDPGVICYSFPESGIFADCRFVRSSGTTSTGATSITFTDRSGHLVASGAVVAGDACAAER